MSQKIQSLDKGGTSLSVPSGVSRQDLERAIYKKTDLYRAKLQLVKNFPEMNSFIKLEY